MVLTHMGGKHPYQGKYYYCYFCKCNVEPNVIPGNSFRHRVNLCPTYGGGVYPATKAKPLNIENDIGSIVKVGRGGKI